MLQRSLFGRIPSALVFLLAHKRRPLKEWQTRYSLQAASIRSSQPIGQKKTCPKYRTISWTYPESIVQQRSRNDLRDAKIVPALVDIRLVTEEVSGIAHKPSSSTRHQRATINGQLSRTEALHHTNSACRITRPSCQIQGGDRYPLARPARDTKLNLAVVLGLGLATVYCAREF